MKNSMVRGIVLFVLLMLAAALCLGEFTSGALVSPLLTPQAYMPNVVKQVPMPTPRPPLRGVGCITQVDYSCTDVIASGATWMQDWSMLPKDCGMRAICQAWGLNSEYGWPDPRCEIVALWNEPSIEAQAHIAPAVGAERWTYVEQRRDAWGVEISTPCDEEQWISTWANEFYDIHQRWPIFDWICIHSYPAAYTAEEAAEETLAAVESAHLWSLDHGGNGRVLLHEFAVWPAWGEGIPEEYMQLVVPALDEAGIMYAWFALSDVGDYMTGGSPYAEYYDTSLVGSAGVLTELGLLYRDL